MADVKDLAAKVILFEPRVVLDVRAHLLREEPAMLIAAYQRALNFRGVAKVKSLRHNCCLIDVLRYVT